MMHRVLFIGSWLAVAAISISARGESLTVGDPAPRLEVSSFVKGTPIDRLEKGKIHVVEFWATWCGPCRESIPHLTKLQKKYPSVTFIGVSVWEQDQEEVGPFVKEMGDKMGYRVAIDKIPDKGDGNDGAMAKNWMAAAGEAGIPAAFVVNAEGKVAWIGHPMELDKPLEEVVAGTHDLARAVKERKEARQTEAAFAKLQEKLAAAEKAKDPKAMLKVLDEAIAETPPLGKMLAPFKLSLLIATGETAKALALGEQLSETASDDPAGLNNIAWMIVDPDNARKAEPELLKFALRLATRADELAKGKDPAAADTLAKVHFDLGDAARALEIQKRALQAAAGTPLADDEGMKARLETYRKAAEKKSKD